MKKWLKRLATLVLLLIVGMVLLGGFIVVGTRAGQVFGLAAG